MRPERPSASTSFLTSCERDFGQIKRASGVSITTRSLTPIAATSRSGAEILHVGFLELTKRPLDHEAWHGSSSKSLIREDADLTDGVPQPGRQAARDCPKKGRPDVWVLIL